MLTQLLSNAIEAIAVRDGQTIPEVVTVVVESTLGTLRKPDEDMKRVGAAVFADRTWLSSFSYEDIEAVFVAMINEAAKP